MNTYEHMMTPHVTGTKPYTAGIMDGLGVAMASTFIVLLPVLSCATAIWPAGCRKVPSFSTAQLVDGRWFYIFGGMMAPDRNRCSCCWLFSWFMKLYDTIWNYCKLLLVFSFFDPPDILDGLNMVEITNQKLRCTSCVAQSLQFCQLLQNCNPADPENVKTKMREAQYCPGSQIIWDGTQKRVTDYYWKW